MLQATHWGEPNGPTATTTRTLVIKANRAGESCRRGGHIRWCDLVLIRSGGYVQPAAATARQREEAAASED
jgi:hypothetical protein